MPLAAKSVFSKSHILLPALYYFVSLASPLVQISVSGHVKGIPMRHPSQNEDLSKHSNEKPFFQTNKKQLQIPSGGSCFPTLKGFKLIKMY